jgi:hypothetical protein
MYRDAVHHQRKIHPLMVIQVSASISSNKYTRHAYILEISKLSQQADISIMQNFSIYHPFNTHWSLPPCQPSMLLQHLFNNSNRELIYTKQFSRS